MQPIRLSTLKSGEEPVKVSEEKLFNKNDDGWPLNPLELLYDKYHKTILEHYFGRMILIAPDCDNKDDGFIIAVVGANVGQAEALHQIEQIAGENNLDTYLIKCPGMKNWS